jgi:ADP-dependent NAD(P)H-hydrate dehydratase
MTSITVTAELLRSMPLPDIDRSDDKDSRGRVLVIAGGPEVPGGAVLCGQATLRAGAGKLQLAAAGAWAQQLGFALPEARVIKVAGTRGGDISRLALPALLKLVGGVDATIIGPGMLDEATASDLAAGLIAGGPQTSLVIDAAALTDLARHARQLDPLHVSPVLTPHCGEMAAFLGIRKAEVETDPIGTALSAAELLGAVVVLKGKTTYIATPSGEVWRYDGGVVGLGTSGSGDVLAGLIGGLLARGAEPLKAALWGVFVHGAAGRVLSESIGTVGFLARELLPELPRILERLKSSTKVPSPMPS